MCPTAASPLPAFCTKQRLECHCPRNRSNYVLQEVTRRTKNCFRRFLRATLLHLISHLLKSSTMDATRTAQLQWAFQLKSTDALATGNTRSTHCTTISWYKEPSANHSAKVTGLDSREEKWKSQPLSMLWKNTALLEDQPSMNPFCRPSALLLQSHPMPKNSPQLTLVWSHCSYFKLLRKLRTMNHPNHIFYLSEALCSSSLFATCLGFKALFAYLAKRLCTSHSPSGAWTICNDFQTCLPQPVYL